MSRVLATFRVKIGVPRRPRVHHQEREGGATGTPMKSEDQAVGQGASPRGARKHFGLVTKRLEVSGWDKLSAQLNHARTVGPAALT